MHISSDNGTYFLRLICVMKNVNAFSSASPFALNLSSFSDKSYNISSLTFSETISNSSICDGQFSRPYTFDLYLLVNAVILDMYENGSGSKNNFFNT